MARNVTTSGTFPLTLSWVVYPTDQVTVTYSLANGILTRSYYFDSTLTSTMVVATGVSSSSTCVLLPFTLPNGTIYSQTLQVKLFISTESRTVVIFPRVIQTTLTTTTTTPIGAPTVTGIIPNIGITSGGTGVTVTGTNLNGVSAVFFGSVRATSWVTGGSTQISAVSPLESAGTVDITVVTAGGTSATSSNDQFTFQDLPTVTGVTPNSGTVNGGDSVTITGTNFNGVNAVTFGGTPAASYTMNSATSITAVSPAAGSIGFVDITVATPVGTSATGSADQFTYLAGAASKLVFTQQPSGGSGGVVFGQPTVTVEDSLGNIATTYAGSVTVSITSGTGATGATLSGTTAVSVVSGVATFSGLSINKSSANAYTLTATSGALPSAPSGTFTITTGAASQLVFTQQPSNGTVSVAFGTQPVVAAADAGGNTVTTFGSSIALTITTGTGTSGAALGGTTSKTPSGGVATFSGLSINKAGTGYKLTATSGTLTSATSGAFNIAGAASKLVFTQQPSGGTGGTVFGTQPVVTVEDVNGSTVTTSTISVAVAITSGTGATGATLSGTTPVAAVNGIVTFTNLKIDKAGSNYTLTASSGTLTTGTSGTFSITVGVATQMVFTTSPPNSTGGAVFIPQPVVTVKDAGGNTVTTYTSTVTVSITSGTGATGATLSGTTAVSAVSGVATFSGLSINKSSASNYTLTATDGTLNATSSPFTISVGAASQLVFTKQPAGALAGTAFIVQPVVAAADAGGNTVTTFVSSVTLTITTGTSGAVLGGTTSKAASSGVATFSGLSINTAGTGYKLTATSGALSGASSLFNVIGVPVNIGQANSTSTDTSLSVPVPAGGIAAGNTVIVSFAMNPATAGVVTVTAPGVNIFTPDADCGTGGTVRTLIFSFLVSTTALTSSNSIQISYPSCQYKAVSIYSVAGLSSYEDQDTTAIGSNTNPSSGATPNTTQATEIIFGAIGGAYRASTTFTAGSGFTPLTSSLSDSTRSSSSATIQPEYKIVGVTGAYTANGTLLTSRDWGAAVATYY
jgi:hypothetical protein